VVLAAGGYPGSYNKGDLINGLPKESIADQKVFHAGTTINDDGHVVTNGGRILCVTGLGDNVCEAQQKAYHLASQISWKGVYHRRDIGYRAIERERKNGLQDE